MAPANWMVRHQVRMQAIPPLLRTALVAPLVFGSVGLAVYWWVTYTGLYRWLAEWQLTYLGAYYQMYTGLLTLVLMFAPAMLVLFLVGFLLDVSGLIRVDPEGSGQFLAQQARTDEWMRSHQGRVAGLVLGTMSLVAGAIFAYAGLTTGALTEVKLSDLEGGQAPPSRWVRLQGRLIYEQMLTQQGTEYIPVVSEKWKPGDPVALYAAAWPKDRPHANPAVLEGVLNLGGLPGPVRTIFEQRGPQPGPDYRVLEVNRTPERSTQMGYGLLGLAGAVFALTGVVWLFKAIRSR